MRHEVSFYRFRANITREGTIIVPGDVVARFRTGQAILVSVAPAVRLGSGGEIDDEEVAAIATLQAVPADVIHRCLNAQGALAGRVRFTGRKPQRQPGKR